MSNFKWIEYLDSLPVLSGRRRDSNWSAYDLGIDSLRYSILRICCVCMFCSVPTWVPRPLLVLCPLLRRSNEDSEMFRQSAGGNFKFASKMSMQGRPYSTRVNVPESLSIPIFNAERASDLNAGDVSETAWSVRPASISAIISTPDAANRGSLPLNLKWKFDYRWGASELSERLFCYLLHNL